MHIIPIDELRQSYRIIKSALKEDIRTGDITTSAIVSPRSKAHAVITAKSAGILAGIHFCAQAFSMVNQYMSVYFPVEEGLPVKRGQKVLEIRGSTGAILKAERTALNLLGRMSGIAAMTARFVQKVNGTRAKILDTRKTMPGLRIFDKYAVRIGGGHNHRFGLNDMFLIKENHIAAAGDITAAVKYCRKYRKKTKANAQIVVEASSRESAQQAADAGADRVLLDNLKPDQVREIVLELREKREHKRRAPAENRVEIEVSGGITLKNVRAYAETGVDYISVGMLTHSVAAVDYSLLIM